MSEWRSRGIFPCVTHEERFDGVTDESFVVRPLGHGLVAVLWAFVGHVIGAVSRAGLAQLEIPEADAWDLALENLHRVIQEGEIQLVRAQWPQSQAVVCAGPHWLASALVLHSGFHELVAEQVASEEIYVALPARDHALFFPKASWPHVKEEVRRVAHGMASHSREPFGENLFIFSPAGVRPA